MKRILLAAVGLSIVSSLSACSPYYWEDQYQGDAVNLDGPLRRNIQYVNGGTSFQPSEQPAIVQSGQANARTITMQAPQAITVAAAQPTITTGTTTMTVPSGSTAFAAPPAQLFTNGNVQVTTQQPSTVQLSSAAAPVSTSISGSPVAVGSAAAVGSVTTATTQATVPLAYATAGQAQNLQTRRVGDVGIIVFSNLISDEVAQGAAQRSCSQIGKTAATSEASDIQMGIRQLNFSCS